MKGGTYLTLINQFYMDLDLKRRFERFVATFRTGDNVELIMSIFNDGKEFDISSAVNATIYQKTCSGTSLKGQCTFDTIDGKRVVRYTLDELYTIETGFNTMMLVLDDGEKEISIQPFSIYINDDLTSASGSYIELIQDLMRQVEELTLELNNTIKLEEKGAPNGVATLDENGKIPDSQIPQTFNSFLEHIPQTVYKHQVHGMRINSDGILQHETEPNTWVDTGIGGGSSGGGSEDFLNVYITVDKGIVNLQYVGVPTVTSQKWSIGEQTQSYFNNNGNSFNGTSFTVSQVGIHTLWYRDSNGNSYVKSFNVTNEQLETVNIEVEVYDGVVTISTDKELELKKWDKGQRDIPYFQYEGNLFMGNSFEITEVGFYTVYVKDVEGTEAVHVFEVTEDMINPPEEIERVITDLNVGDIFKWDDETYMLLDQDDSKSLIMRKDYIRVQFDNNGKNSLNLSDVDNIGYYLNTTYYNESILTQRDKIIENQWSHGALTSNLVGEEDTIFYGQKLVDLSVTLAQLENAESSSKITAKFAPMSFTELLKYSDLLLKYDAQLPSDPYQPKGLFSANFTSVMSRTKYNTGILVFNHDVDYGFRYLMRNPVDSLTKSYVVTYVDNSFIAKLDVTNPEIIGRVVESAIYVKASDNSEVVEMKWDYGNRDAIYFETNGNKVIERYGGNSYKNESIVHTPQTGEVTIYAKDLFGNTSVKVFNIGVLNHTVITLKNEIMRNAVNIQLNKDYTAPVTISDCASIEVLDIYEITTLEDIIYFPNLIEFSGRTMIGNTLTSLNGLENAPKLKYIYYDSHGYLADISTLNQLNNLESVSLFNMSSGVDVTPVNKSNLRIIDLTTDGTLNGLTSLTNVKDVVALTLRASNLTDSTLNIITSGMNKLTRLTLGGTGGMTLSFLSNTPNILHLSIYGTSNVTFNLNNLSNLSTLSNLQTINISDTSIKTLNGINSLSNLQDMTITNNKSLTDISALSNMNNISSVRLNDNNIESFQAINRVIPSIRVLHLTGNATTNYPSKSNYPGVHYANGFDWI